jgi:predicted fused transcriptional regulator/phosphomethylpyrimidine kinase
MHQGILMTEDPNSLKQQLEASIDSLLLTRGFAQLIPEVGSNFVACVPKATQLSQVVGLTGRIILVKGQPEAVGEVDYGWAPFMGQVILKAHSVNNQIRSAISLRNSAPIVEAARKAELQVVGYRLPENHPIPDCMTLLALSKLNFVPEVLFDWGAHGIEPLVITFGSDPEEVSRRVQGIIKELVTDE